MCSLKRDLQALVFRPLGFHIDTSLNGLDAKGSPARQVVLINGALDRDLFRRVAVLLFD